MDINKRDFNSDASTWDNTPSRIEFARNIVDEIFKRIHLKDDMLVLDYGAGTGLVTLGIQPYVKRILAADSSEGMLAKLSEKIKTGNITNVGTMLLDLESGDDLPGKYDLIISSMTFHHIANIELVLSKFFYAINPSGYICIADLDSEDGRFHNDNTGVFHHGFDRSVLHKAFLNAGFADVRDCTAAEIEKKDSNGEIRKFGVFLMTGYKD
jgi:ubiquinone/menaquinone biosynthesis C-methylase UbiE